MAESYKTAREILGGDFITPKQVSGCFSGIVYAVQQLGFFAHSLPPLHVLEWCKKNNHVLIPGPDRPMSLVDIRARRPKCFKEERKDAWVGLHECFTNDKVQPCWIMISKGLVRDSVSRSWDEQNLLLLDTEFVPNLAQIAWFLIVYKYVMRDYLLPDASVHTSSCVQNCGRICIGHFDVDNGLSVYGPYQDHEHYCDIGFMSARKL